MSANNCSLINYVSIKIRLRYVTYIDSQVMAILKFLMTTCMNKKNFSNETSEIIDKIVNKYKIRKDENILQLKENIKIYHSFTIRIYVHKQ